MYIYHIPRYLFVCEVVNFNFLSLDNTELLLAGVLQLWC